MKKTLISLIFPLLATVVQAQSTNTALKIQREEWVPSPTLHTIDPQYAKEAAVILMDKRRMEYVDAPNDELIVYRTLHKIIHVNDDKGIESFNRIYLGISDDSNIVDIHARTILPNGKIIEVDKQNIKDLKEEDGNMYKIFAMEGLEKGCEVEYYYTYKRDASFFGRETAQGGFPVLDFRLQVTAPERLIFEIKGYNCQPATSDTTVDGKRTVFAGIKNIEGAEEEKYAAYDANLERIEYKLSHNNAVSDGSVRLFTWNELAKRAFTLYSSYNEKELKKTDALINSNKWDKLHDQREMIVAVENFLKKNFTTREDISSDDAENIEWIIRNRIASYRGIIRLYGAIFQQLGVDHQFVLACDRSESAIDKSFENWNIPENPLLYFPGTGKFMAPTLLETRYPWINPYWGAADALYCKGTTIGSFTTAIAEIKPVPLEDYHESFNAIDSKLSLNSTNDTLLVDMQQRYGGYSGSVYRADFTLASAEEQKNILKELIKFGTNSENVVSSELHNADFESYSDNKPFTVHAIVKANELVETAGNKILVKIGEIIGPQAEMYQEKRRLFPMQLAYPHTLERHIDFSIPDGYTVRNLNDLNIRKVYTDQGDTTMGFTSSYTVEGNLVKVHVMEEYRRVFYPLSEYEHFREVINASADFNKIVLVLNKKS